MSDSYPTPENGKPSDKNREGFSYVDLQKQKMTEDHYLLVDLHVEEQEKHENYVDQNPLNRLIDAETNAKIEDTRMRVDFAQQMRSHFARLNLGVYSLISVMAIAETILIIRGIINPNQRVVNEKIIGSLILGTVIQSGAAFLGMVKYLFPKTPHYNPLPYQAAERMTKTKKSKSDYNKYAYFEPKPSVQPSFFTESGIKKGKHWNFKYWDFEFALFLSVISMMIGLFFGAVIWMPAKTFAETVPALTAAPLSASMPIASSSPAVTSPAPCTGQPIDINITQNVDMASGKPATRHVGKPSHIAPVAQCASTSANR